MFGAQALAEHQATVAGQHHIENDQVRQTPLQRPPHTGAVDGNFDGITVLFEKLFQQGEDFKVIVHQQ
jgi:hypothetical protein